MKDLLQKFIKQFSQYRDWLLVLLFLGGIFFFMRQGQAVRDQNPDQVWQIKYAEVVKPVPGSEPGQAGAQASTPVDPAEIFRQLPLKDIESMSTRPMFSPAEEYNRLRVRLEALKKDYQDAIANGETRTAVDKLTQYCKDDPKGTILEWTTPPQMILSNLICEETAKSLSTAIEAAKAATQGSASEGGDLPKAIETLDKAYGILKDAIQEAEANPECTADAKGESRIAEAKSLLDSIGKSKEDLHNRLLQQEYNGLVRDGGAIDAKSTAESVAELVQRLRNFRDLQSKLDPNGSIMNQTQVEHLQEIQSKVESGKEARVAQVRQKIGALTAVQGYDQDANALQEILKMFDTLKMLEDPKADSDRREFEAYQQKLEASGILDEMGKLLEIVETETDRIQAMLTNNEDYRPIAKTITDSFVRLEELKKKPGIKRANQAAYRDVATRYQKASNKWKQIKPKLRLD